MLGVQYVYKYLYLVRCSTCFYPTCLSIPPGVESFEITVSPLSDLFLATMADEDMLSLVALLLNPCVSLVPESEEA